MKWLGKLGNLEPEYFLDGKSRKFVFKRTKYGYLKRNLGRSLFLTFCFIVSFLIFLFSSIKLYEYSLPKAKANRELYRDIYPFMKLERVLAPENAKVTKQGLVIDKKLVYCDVSLARHDGNLWVYRKPTGEYFAENHSGIWKTSILTVDWGEETLYLSPSVDWFESNTNITLFPQDVVLTTTEEIKNYEESLKGNPLVCFILASGMLVLFACELFGFLRQGVYLELDSEMVPTWKAYSSPEEFYSEYSRDNGWRMIGNAVRFYVPGKSVSITARLKPDGYLVYEFNRVVM